MVELGEPIIRVRVSLADLAQPDAAVRHGDQEPADEALILGQFITEEGRRDARLCGEADPNSAAHEEQGFARADPLRRTAVP